MGEWVEGQGGDYKCGLPPAILKIGTRDARRRLGATAAHSYSLKLALNGVRNQLPALEKRAAS